MKILSNCITIVFLYLIKVYQYGISPLLKPSCRFMPTCSEYTKQCITYYGPLKGSYLGIKRILKCHPFGGRGYDPVPLNKIKENNGTSSKL